MKKTILLFVPLLFVQALQAQNLNPEVHVTNEYQTRLDDVSKQGPSMRVPDSLLKFDYHFDYSVFDSPYKGAYEFSPYSVAITPDPRTYDGRKLYVKAGAGYVFRPELDVVWAAIDRKRFALNVFANGGGFLGRYRHIVPTTFELWRDRYHKGFDFDANAGVDLRFSIGKFKFHSEVGYGGFYTKHEEFLRDNCHSPYATLRFSYAPSSTGMLKGGVSYRFVYDWLNGSQPVKEHEMLGDFTVSVRPAKEYRINADANVAVNSYYWGFNLHPHLIYQLGMLDIDAGFRVGVLGGKFSASPDITAAVHLLDDHLKVYAGAVGNDHFTTYWDYKTNIHHFYGPTYVDPRPIREVADIFLGFNGHADFGLQFDLKGGYRFLKDAPLWAVAGNGMETLYFLDCDMLHADLALSWASDRVNLDGGVHLVKIPQGVPTGVFEPALVSGTFKGSYNWLKRIWAGLSVDMSSARLALVNGYERKIPGYVDLGIFGEYRLNRRLTVWLKGSNLLNHEVRISPMYSEYGPAVVAGVTFSL